MSSKTAISEESIIPVLWGFHSVFCFPLGCLPDRRMGNIPTPRHALRTGAVLVVERAVPARAAAETGAGYFFGQMIGHNPIIWDDNRFVKTLSNGKSQDRR